MSVRRSSGRRSSRSKPSRSVRRVSRTIEIDEDADHIKMLEQDIVDNQQELAERRQDLQSFIEFKPHLHDTIDNLQSAYKQYDDLEKEGSTDDLSYLIVERIEFLNEEWTDEEFDQWRTEIDDELKRIKQDFE